MAIEQICRMVLDVDPATDASNQGPVVYPVEVRI